MYHLLYHVLITETLNSCFCLMRDNFSFATRIVALVLMRIYKLVDATNANASECQRKFTRATYFPDTSKKYFQEIFKNFVA
jgi:hypothetical protein